MDRRYRDTIALLLDVAPFVFARPGFAMKGGTAINLFLREMPRLSVDIDLVFVDPAAPERDAALAAIENALSQVAQTLKERLRLQVQRTTSGSANETKLFISRGDTRVKVEVNHVFRGTVYPTVERGLTPQAEELFSREVVVPMLAPDELYASKLVAALDRQHPRDLFDVMLLYDNGGITPRMRRAFVVYLAGHNRPMHELLPPRQQDVREPFASEFVGMTAQAVGIEQLEATRERLFAEVPTALDEAERKFLVSMHQLEPEWDLLGIPGVERLPALRWKILNLERLKQQNRPKFDEMSGALAERLGF
jgi:hypothetical protein